MNRCPRLVRASFYLSLVLPLTLLACGQAFESVGDAGEGEGGIVLGDGGGGADATKDGPADTSADVRHDGPADSGVRDGMPEGGMDVVTAETGGGCPAGFLTCSDGGCAQQGPTNCGTCGNDCTALPHVQNPACSVSGQCTFTCQSGWAHCTSNPQDGCETNTTTPQNCDMCGVTCSNPAPICVAGTGCLSGCPASKPTLCNGNTCVDTTNDPQNCNTCGNVCPAGPANSTPTCSSSTCGWQCNSGYTECNGTSCFDENNDVNHCGSCTNSCPGATNGQPECSNGTCAVACNSGLTYCPANSACNNLQNDTNNCGTCDHACPAGPPNSATTCGGATCGWTCDANYQQCGNTCLLAVPDAVHGVFVAPGGATSSCGAINAPCGLISSALTVVTQSGGTKNIIYVAQSSTPYADQLILDSVTSPATTVTIEGGWIYTGGGQWSHPCAQDPSQTTVTTPAGMFEEWGALLIAGNIGTVTVDTMTLVNANVAPVGNSMYGAYVGGSQANQVVVVLTNVAIQVAGGGAGANGAQSQQVGSSPPSSCTAGDGANGMIGAGGPGAVAGTYGSGGYAPQTGGTGLVGGNGDNGTAAPLVGQPSGPQCVYAYPGTSTNNSNCCDNGSGVGCMTCSGSPTKQLCASVGTPGCGSGGSGGGTGGAGGGASIGLFSQNAAVSLDKVSITTGSGGNGGNGGPGGSISQGTPGVQGASTQYESACHNFCNNQTMTCTCDATTPLATLKGSTGGNGGTGGIGGQGGGGSGGDSLCYATYGTAPVTVTGLTCTPGKAGVGGNSGLPNQGAPGVSGTNN